MLPVLADLDLALSDDEELSGRIAFSVKVSPCSHVQIFGVPAQLNQFVALEARQQGNPAERVGLAVVRLPSSAKPPARSGGLIGATAHEVMYRPPASRLKLTRCPYTNVSDGSRNYHLGVRLLKVDYTRRWRIRGGLSYSIDDVGLRRRPGGSD